MTEILPLRKQVFVTNMTLALAEFPQCVC